MEMNSMSDSEIGNNVCVFEYEWWCILHSHHSSMSQGEVSELQN